MDDPRYAHLLLKPSDEILEINRKGLSAFSKVMQDFSKSDSLVRGQNDYGYLTSSYFRSHPSIHAGYYDKLENGILYVKNKTTDRFIRKDRSVLITDGTFTSKNDNPNLHTSSNIPSSLKITIAKALKGSKEHLEVLRKHTFYERESRLYIPFNIDYFHKIIKSRDFSHLVSRIYYEFAEAEGYNNIPISTSIFPMEDFQQYLKEKLKSIFKDDSSHIDLNVLKLNENHNFLKLGSYDITLWHDNIVPKIQQGKPAITLNCESNRLIFDTNRYAGMYSLVFASEFFFDFIIQTQTLSRLRTSRKTRNDEGRMMNYTAKVDEFKVSFKMMEEEKNLFNFYEEDFQKKLKKNNKAKKHPEHNPIYLGMELELVVRRDTKNSSNYFSKLISDVAESDFGDHAIIKSDTSIHSEFGLEIVTIPATLAYHKKMFEDNFFSKKYAFHKRLMSTEHCGIHVHISKNVLTELKWGQFISFMNSVENTPFIDAMSNRSPTHYCLKQALAPKNSHGINVSAKIVAKACKDGIIKRGLHKVTRSFSNEGRRVSVNVENGDTIEVRLFKSSNDKNNVLRKLEFCESLVRFVRNHSLQQMTTYDYVNFILDGANKKEYPYVVRWLASKNYIGHTRKKIQSKNKYTHIYGDNKVSKPNTIYHKEKEQK